MPDKLAQESVQKEEGQKSNNGSGNGSGDRTYHLQRPVDGRSQWWFTPFIVGIDIFTNHNGIVNQNSDHNNHPEQRNHINGDA